MSENNQWHRLVDEEGNGYFYNYDTGASEWYLPDGGVEVGESSSYDAAATTAEEGNYAAAAAAEFSDVSDAYQSAAENQQPVDDVAEETQYAAAHENDSAPTDATSASDTVAPTLDATDQAVDAESPEAIVDGGVASDADALAGSEWEEPDPTATADDAYAEAGPTDAEATTDAALAHTDFEQPSADPDTATATTTPADADTATSYPDTTATYPDTTSYPADDTTSYPTDDTTSYPADDAATTYPTEAEEEPIVDADAGSQDPEADDQALADAGWEEHDDGEGNIYYWNRNTEESRWARPVLKVLKVLSAFGATTTTTAATVDTTDTTTTDTTDTTTPAETAGEEAPLPANWELHTDEGGYVFYWNKVTEESTWTRPTLESHPEQPAAEEPKVDADSIMKEFGAQAGKGKAESTEGLLPCPDGFDPSEWAELDRDVQLDLLDMPVDDPAEETSFDDDFSSDDEPPPKPKIKLLPLVKAAPVLASPAIATPEAQTRADIMASLKPQRTKDIRHQLEMRGLSTSGLRQAMAQRLCNAMLDEQAAMRGESPTRPSPKRSLSRVPRDAIKRMSSKPEERLVAVGGKRSSRRPRRFFPDSPSESPRSFPGDDEQTEQQKRAAMLARELQRASEALLHKHIKSTCGVKDFPLLRKLGPLPTGGKNGHDEAVVMEEYRHPDTKRYFYYIPKRKVGYWLRAKPCPGHQHVKLRENRRFISEREEEEDADFVPRTAEGGAGGHVTCDVACPTCMQWLRKERWELFLQTEEDYRAAQSRSAAKYTGVRKRYVPPGRGPTPPSTPKPQPPRGERPANVRRRRGRPIFREMRAGDTDGSRLVDKPERERRVAFEADMRKREAGIDERKRRERHGWARLADISVGEEPLDEVHPADDIGWRRFFLPTYADADEERVRNILQDVLPQLAAFIEGNVDLTECYYNGITLKGQWENPYTDEQVVLPLSHYEEKTFNEDWVKERERRVQWARTHDELKSLEQRRRAMWEEERRQRELELTTAQQHEDELMAIQREQRRRFLKLKTESAKLKQKMVTRLTWEYAIGQRRACTSHLVYDAAAGKHCVFKEATLKQRDADFTHRMFRKLKQAVMKVGKVNPHLVKFSVCACPVYGDVELRLQKLMIITNFCENGSLYDRCKERVPTPLALRWVRAMAWALQTMHECRMSHGNLHSRSAFIDSTGELRVGNFCLLKGADDVLKAPEDMKALGHLLVELVTGRIGREQNSYDQRSVAQILKTIPWSAGRTVGELVTNLLQPDPKLRWTAQSVMECIDRGIVVRISNLVIDVDVDAVGKRFNAASGYESDTEQRLAAEAMQKSMDEFTTFVQTPEAADLIKYEVAKSKMLRERLYSLRRLNGVLPFENELRDCARRHFRSVDKDDSGDISPEEFSELLKDLGFKGLLRGEVRSVFHALDTDKSGSISFEEFSHWFGMGHAGQSASLPNQVVKNKKTKRMLRDMRREHNNKDAETQQLMKRIDTQSALMRIVAARGKKARLEAIAKYRRQHPPPQKPLWTKVETLRRMNRLGIVHPSNYTREVVEAAFNYFSETPGADGSDGVYNELDYDWSLQQN